MEISRDELGACGIQKAGDYSGFGSFGGFEEDDYVLKTASFSDYQMVYDTVSYGVSDSSNGSLMLQGSIGNALLNDLLSFSEDVNVITSLPEDPFCMNIRSTLNSISDWFHETQIGVDQKLFESSLDSFSTMLQQQKVSSLEMNGFEGLGEAILPEDPFSMKVTLTLREEESDLDDGGEEPHLAFDLVLSYLEMRDVLAVEGVCRSLRDSVRKESSFWTTIDLSDSFLKYRVTDDSLLKLTGRAQGHLQCLNLGGCVSITDNGLMQVLASNPRLKKLCVSGCHRLSTIGVLTILRDLKSSNQLGIESLITGGALYFTTDQFEELNVLLGADAKAGPKSRRQRLYTSCRSEFSLEDYRGTDLEICPWCEKPSLIFDCAAETCPLKDHPSPKQSCRACVVCIERCHDCGSCLNDCEHKPFCFAFSCVICYKKMSN